MSPSPYSSDSQLFASLYVGGKVACCCRRSNCRRRFSGWVLRRRRRRRREGINQIAERLPHSTGRHTPAVPAPSPTHSSASRRPCPSAVRAPRSAPPLPRPQEHGRIHAPPPSSARALAPRGSAARCHQSARVRDIRLGPCRVMRQPMGEGRFLFRRRFQTTTISNAPSLPSRRISVAECRLQRTTRSTPSAKCSGPTESARSRAASSAASLMRFCDACGTSEKRERREREGEREGGESVHLQPSRREAHRALRHLPVARATHPVW